MKQFIYRINGQDYIVAVNKIEDSIAQVAVNGSNYEVELVNNEDEVTITSRPVEKKVTATAAPQKTVAATPSKPAAAPAGKASSAGAVKAPLPGIIIDVLVNVGDTVKKGQTVVMLEAMKMENAIQAPQDGTVASIEVNKGDSVLEGVTLVTIG